MVKFMKGNYELPQKEQKSAPENPSVTEEMEKSALARLGGSICFVMKKDNFLWTGGQKDE